MTLQRGRMFELLLFKRRVTDQDGGLLGRDSLEQEQEKDSWSCLE